MVTYAIKNIEKYKKNHSILSKLEYGLENSQQINPMCAIIHKIHVTNGQFI